MPSRPAARRARPLALALCAALLAAACATAGAPGAAIALEGTTWRLVELGGRPALPAAAPAGPDVPFLRFEGDSGRVGGSGGCNQMSGPFTRDGDALRFGALVSTKRACADDARNRQEVDFFAALEATRRYTVAGDTLTLLGADAVALARLVAGQ